MLPRIETLLATYLCCPSRRGDEGSLFILMRITKDVYEFVNRNYIIFLNIFPSTFFNWWSELDLIFHLDSPGSRKKQWQTLVIKHMGSNYKLDKQECKSIIKLKIEFHILLTVNYRFICFSFILIKFQKFRQLRNVWLNWKMA